MCSVSFLECSINGLYGQAKNPYGRATKLHRALASIWSEAFDRQPILAKYQIALALAKREPFEENAKHYRAARALIDLRNAIAHPKELIESERQQQKLEGRLSGMYKFNPKREHYREFFPGRCLSADCACWALQAATKLFSEFKRRMPPTANALSFVVPVDHVLKEIEALRSTSAKK